MLGVGGKVISLRKDATLRRRKVDWGGERWYGIFEAWIEVDWWCSTDIHWNRLTERYCGMQLVVEAHMQEDESADM